MAVADYFLKIEGIEGELQDHKHKGEIDIESWSVGATKVGTAGRGGGGAGKVNTQDVHFTMKVNKASPKLFLACCSGEHLKKVVLTCRKAGKEQQECSKHAFTDVLVSSYQTGGASESVVPVDQFSFNFAKVETEYKEQKADGSLGAPVKAGWDVSLNKRGARGCPGLSCE